MPTSLDLYLPFDAGAGSSVTEDNWRKMARQWLDSGPLDGEDLELEAFGDSTGLQAKVRTGKCFMRGHYGENTATKTITLDAVGGIPGGQSRIDRIILRLDPTNNRIELDKLTGTAAASPTEPALTQTDGGIWEVPLAKITGITNATTTISAGMVTDQRIFARHAHGPRGQLPGGYAEITADVVQATGTTDIPGLTVTVNVGAGNRRIRITSWFNKVATGGVLIREGSTILSYAAYDGTSGQMSGTGPQKIFTPSAGSHTYKLSTFSQGGGSPAVEADAQWPAFILVEDIGPA